MAKTAPLRLGEQTQSDSATATLTERPWNVVVWNDPVTPMTVVVVVLRKIFGFSNNRATQLMLQVHHEGRAIVWSSARERAQHYCVRLQSAGLLATIEQDA